MSDTRHVHHTRSLIAFGDRLDTKEAVSLTLPSTVDDYCTIQCSESGTVASAALTPACAKAWLKESLEALEKWEASK